MGKIRFTGFVLLVLLAACVPAETPVPTPPPSATPLPTSTFIPPPTATPLPTWTPTPLPTPTPSPTPDPYAEFTVDGLTARDYGGGTLQIEEELAVTQAFTRSLFTYPSDGLTIYGFMNVPQGEGPFPVVIVLHGYIDPDEYNTLAYTTRYADNLAQNGYLVLHPNLREYPPSDSGPNRFRVGMAVDVLNLLAIVREQAGRPGSLRRADAQAIGLWGHSMGGGITLRVITVDPGIRAAVLYGSMSGDERTNYERVLYWTGGERGHEELETPEEALRRISPIEYLERIEAAVSIHHSAADAVVPPEWSQDLCERLDALGKQVECFTYAGLPHTFRGEGDRLFMQRVVDFFDTYLKGE